MLLINFYKYLLIVTCFCVIYCESKCTNCNVYHRNELKNTYNIERKYLVPKCCDINERLEIPKNSERAQCVSINKDEDNFEFSPMLYRRNETGFRQIDNYTYLNVVVGNPCAYGKYPLDPKEDSADEHYIFDNGQVLVPLNDGTTLFGLDQFCLEYYYQRNSDTPIITPFMCFEPSIAETPNGQTKVLFYAIGLLISVPFLIATFIVYTAIPELNNLHGKSLACHVLCLAVAFFALALVQLTGETFPKDACIAVAFIIQFSFVACFFWLNVMCFDNWLNVTMHLRSGTTADQEKRYFIWYSLYAWGLPTLLLLFSLIMDLHPAVPSTYIKPRFGMDVCWFNSDQAALPYFYAPIGFIICVNGVLFIFTAKKLASTVQDTRTVVDISETNEFVTILDMKSRWLKYKKLFRLCFLLFVVMGLNWSMEVVSWLVDGSFGIWTVFDVINALQGVLVFCIFVLQRPVRKIVMRRIRALCGMSASDSPASSDSELQHFGP